MVDLSGCPVRGILWVLRSVVPIVGRRKKETISYNEKSGLPFAGRPDCRSIHYVRGLNLTLQFTVHNSFPMSQATRSVMRSSSPRSTVTLPPACSLPSMMSVEMGSSTSSSSVRRRARAPYRDSYPICARR